MTDGSEGFEVLPAPATLSTFNRLVFTVRSSDGGPVYGSLSVDGRPPVELRLPWVRAGTKIILQVGAQFTEGVEAPVTLRFDNVRVEAL